MYTIIVNHEFFSALKSFFTIVSTGKIIRYAGISIYYGLTVPK